jgi:hypothetical protein
MDPEILEDDSPSLSREALLEIRKAKIRKEIESARRLLASGNEPLQVADGFIHETFRIMEDGFRKRNPSLGQKGLNQKVDAVLDFRVKLKSRRKRSGFI